MSDKVCPCCGRHCNLDSPSCGRGAEYAKTGVVPPHKHEENGERHGHHHGHRHDNFRHNERD